MPDTTVETTNAKPQEDWMARRWRPMMGWMYMVVCTFDFMVAPILWSVLQTVMHQTITQWNPLTLQGAGLFHMAMGAVLGIAAYGRTQEKLGGANNGGLSVPQPSTPGVSAPAGGFSNSNPSPAFGSSGFGSSTSSTSSSNTGSFGGSFDTPASAEVTTGFGGKKAPPPITSFPEK